MFTSLGSVPMLFAHAVSTLQSPLRGIHLMWSGPPQFLFAPGGWQVDRRVAAPFPDEQQTCDEISGPSLARLRSRLELKVGLGWFRLTQGQWNGPEPGPCEIFTLELDKPSTEVRGLYRGRHGLAIGMFRGKAVAHQFLPLATDGRQFDFGPAPVDQIVIYGLRAAAVRCCVAAPRTWQGGTTIARLHLPLREFVPALADPAGELAEANKRLAPGESIDPQRFGELTDLLRVAMRGPGRRPIDNLLLMQSDPESPEQMFALDPLRTLVTHPKWRRVMGLGWLDRDPALVQGTNYDYRITGMFPVSDRDARIFGFHTLPPGTALPAEFSLDHCRFRLSTPTVVEISKQFTSVPPQWTTRAGIQLVPHNGLPWFGLGIDEFSAIINLPAPVTRLILELEDSHDLRFSAGDSGGPFSPVQQVPSGGNPLLQFPAPITQLNLVGKGFLFAVRIPGLEVDRMVPLSAILPAVRFDESPLPEAPLEVRIANLQVPRDVALSPASHPIRKLHSPGFKVNWRPAPAIGMVFWPNDLAVPPPLDATAFQVERRVDPNGPFTPVLANEDNMMLGSREEPAPDRTVLFGTDLMQVFPEDAKPRRGLSDEFSYPDVFSGGDETNPQQRLPPPFGSFLRYRVRTLDVIGRASLSWRESNSLRLEKHEAPPQPTAYDPNPADALAGPAPTGVYAKVLVRGSAELTPEEVQLLGASDNAILLRWGWRAPERTQDPLASQFRVYLARSFDTIAGEILNVTQVVPGDWRLDVRVGQAVAANAAAGLALDAGYPFFIVEHTAGTTVQMLVRTRIPDASGNFRKPALGPVAVPLKLAPAMVQPASWTERFVFPSGHAHLPVDTSEQYQAVIRDRLLLTPEHPRDVLWVGVSAADSESYIDDTFPDPGPDGPLPGNESPVVAVLVQTRRVIRPTFSPPLPAGPVPRLLMPEPVAGALHVQLDLASFLPDSGLAAGDLVQPERLAVTALFAVLAVIGNQLFAMPANPQDPAQTPRAISLPNAADQASVIAAVQGTSNLLEDRLAVQLAAIHPYVDHLFRQATSAPVPFAPFDDTLPPTEERYIYRFRRGDMAQRLSAHAAIANVIVRVPSLSPGASPQRGASQAGDPPARLRVRIPPDPRIGHFLVFEHEAIAETAQAEAELLRVPNRTELAPGANVRLRLPDGSVLAPSVQQVASLPSDADGWLAAFDSAGAPGQRMLVWTSTLTVDGVPSPPAGPWRLTIPKPDLQPPVLSVAVTPNALDFSWTLPDPLISSVLLEASGDGALWERASAVRQRADTAIGLPRAAASRQYRLVGRAQDGRRAISNAVTA
jgi:hypothetical protein